MNLGSTQTDEEAMRDLVVRQASLQEIEYLLLPAGQQLEALATGAAARLYIDSEPAGEGLVPTLDDDAACQSVGSWITRESGNELRIDTVRDD